MGVTEMNRNCRTGGVSCVHANACMAAGEDFPSLPWPHSGAGRPGTRSAFLIPEGDCGVLVGDVGGLPGRVIAIPLGPRPTLLDAAPEYPDPAVCSRYSERSVQEMVKRSDAQPRDIPGRAEAAGGGIHARGPAIRPAAPGHIDTGRGLWHGRGEHLLLTAAARPHLLGLRREPGRTELVVTLTQLGYAVGLFLLVPLGDLLENRALASRTLLVTSAALLATGLSPDFGVFLAMSVLVGMTSMVAQILVPYAAQLAPPAERGRVVGTVMAGLLLGILLARTVSSLVAAAWGWRTIYLASAFLMVVLSVLLSRMLPKRPPAHTSTYPQLMLSALRLVREEPVLRRRAVCQALMFGAFSCFWTSVAFELIQRHHLGQAWIGIFALVGAAGAAAAPLAGRLGDQGHGHAGSGVALALAGRP